MEKVIRTYWKTILFFAAVGLVGGYFTGIYLWNTYPADILQQAVEQGLNQTLLGLVSAVQSAGYGLVLGAVGIWLGKKTGLWRDERSITRKPLLLAIAVSVLGGLALILPDLLFFGKHSQAIMDSYAVKPTVSYLIAAVIYGGVIEEVMLRLFMLSLTAWILFKLFEKGRELPSTKTLVIANVVAALLFAAGHLPATAALMGLTPMLVFRCFLLNGGFGLAFGWLYRKFGLRYAMIAHAGCHVVSKLIWILFV